MSKTYTASVLRRQATPRSDKLRTSAPATSSSSYLSSVLVNPAGSNDSVFWKYFGLDEDGGLYVKKTDAGEARNFWTYGQLAGGGIIDDDSGAGGSGGVRNLWALDDVKHGASGVLRSNGDPVNTGDILVYGVIGQSSGADIYGWYAKPENSAGGGGTVTSVGLQAASGSGLSVLASSNTNPITGAGTFTIGIESSHYLPLATDKAAWDGKQDLIDLTHKLDYSLIANTPAIPSAPGTLNTNNSTAQSVNSSEALSGTVKLHKVSKTGSYGDLLNTPTFTNKAATLTAGQTVTVATIGGVDITIAVPSFALASALNGYQPLDADLTSIAGLTGTTGVLKKTSANNWALDTNIETYAGYANTINGYFSNAKLKVTNGGTGLSSISKGAILYASASNTIAALSANGTATKKFLTQTNDGAPAWGTIGTSDLPLSSLYVARNQVTASAANATLLGIDGFTNAASTSASNDTSKVVWDSNAGAWHFYGGIYSDSFVSAGGLNSGSGGGGGVENLWALNDVYHVNGAIVHADDSALANGDVLTYNSTKGKWLAAPTAATVTEQTVAGWGFTKNAGTITGITMNGASKGTSGIVDLGTVITSHQDISGKADKVSSPTNGNFAALDSNGNLTDSGHKHSDYLTAHQSLGLVAGASGGTANATTTNGNTYINLLGGGVNKGGVKIIGSTNVSVASNNAGQITVTGPDLSGYQAKVSALGSNTEPVYISAAGAFSKAKKYAGGTAVTRNGVDKSAGTTSFYAPEGGGTDGYVLVAAGTSNAPTWRSEIFIDKTNSRVGIGTTSPTYKLHVVGNSYFNGNLDIATGQYLHVGNGSLLQYTTNDGLTIETQSDPINITAGDDNSIYMTGEVTICTGIIPEVADGNYLGSEDYSFGELWANRWYPNPGDDTHYIEWDSSAGAFKIVGDVYATGQVAAGGVASNS